MIDKKYQGNDRIVATAGISAVGNKYKVRHRAEFGIDVVKKYWGLGIGKKMMKACVQCAQNAGYQQLELEVVADNQRAVNMYKSIVLCLHLDDTQTVDVEKMSPRADFEKLEK